MPSVESAINISKQQTQSSMPLPTKYVDHPDYTEYVYKTSPSGGKKFGVGIASWFMPGLGQCINGQWGKGVGMFAGTAAIALAPTVALISAMKNHSFSRMGAISIVTFLGTLGMQIFSTVDAVKNAKSETVQIVPKQKIDNPHISYSV